MNHQSLTNTTKIIHCADLHLDSALQSSLSPEAAEDRRRELLRTFVRMVEYAAAEEVHSVLIAGDLFDTSVTRELTRSTVLSCITSHPSVTFFYLRGNHDDNHFIDNLTEIPENLKLFGTGWSCYEWGGIAIYGCEQLTSGGEYDYDALCPDPGMINIVMLHGQISESGSGTDWNIDLRRLRGKGIDYLALGHIHSFREEKLDGRGTLCYPGCLEGRGFDECGEHGFVLLEIDGTSHAVVSRFVPFASRRLFTVQADVSGCYSTGEMVKAAADALASSGCRPCDLVRLELTGSLDAACEKDVSYVRTSFADRYYSFCVADKTDLRFDIESHSHDRSLKGEFIRSVCADSSLTDEEKAEVIRCGLLALSGEEAV